MFVKSFSVCSLYLLSVTLVAAEPIPGKRQGLFVLLSVCRTPCLLVIFVGSEQCLQHVHI